MLNSINYYDRNKWSKKPRLIIYFQGKKPYN